MKKVVLQFGSLTDMINFESKTRSFGHDHNYYRFTLSGYFEKAKIEMAKAEYNATVTEDLNEST